MKRTSLLFFILLLKFDVNGQDKFVDGPVYSVGIDLNNFTKDRVPFWMRTNKFGAIPLSGLSGTVKASVTRDYKTESKKFDWGYGLDTRILLGTKELGVQLIEAYAKAKLGLFEFKIGRSKDVVGIIDTALSSGSFSVAGNALGIPKLEFSISDYIPFPFMGESLYFKGNFAYGIIGNEPIASYSYTRSESAFTYFHQKSLYIRIGHDQTKLKFFGGINHNVMWGDENKYYKDWNLSGTSTLLKATFGGVHKDSKVGNHGGSIDQKIEYQAGNINLSAYHQFFYEVGGIYHLNNIKDGLWGIVIKNQKRSAVGNSNFRWNKLLVEFLATKSQGGELDAKITPSGDEDYYNNYLYLNGWRYHSENLGTNFITNKDYMRSELPSRAYESHSNNRLYLLHVGADVNISRTNIISKLSWSKNYGTYGTSAIGNSTGNIRTIGPPPYFTKVNQFSGYLEISRYLNRQNAKIGVLLSVDSGNLLYNSAGAAISLSKFW